MNALISPPRTPKPIVVIVGARIWTDTEVIENHLSHLQPIMVLDGSTRGAETIASDWCERTGTLNLRIPKHYRRWGSTAHIQRNTLMLETAKLLRHGMKTSLIVLTYPLGDSPGTRNMIQQATEQNIELYVTEHPDKNE